MLCCRCHRYKAVTAFRIGNVYYVYCEACADMKEKEFYEQGKMVVDRDTTCNTVA